MTAWADKTRARRHWADSGAMDDTKLDELLAAAQRACEQYAPTLAPTDPVPDGTASPSSTTPATWPPPPPVTATSSASATTPSASATSPSTVKALLRLRRRGGVG